MVCFLQACDSGQQRQWTWYARSFLLDAGSVLSNHCARASVPGTPGTWYMRRERRGGYELFAIGELAGRLPVFADTVQGEAGRRLQEGIGLGCTSLYK